MKKEEKKAKKEAKRAKEREILMEQLKEYQMLK